MRTLDQIKVVQIFIEGEGRWSVEWLNIDENNKQPNVVMKDIIIIFCSKLMRKFCTQI